MTDTEQAPIADETPSPLMAALLAQVAAQPRIKLVCIGCGAMAVALTACPACGSMDGYGPSMAECVGDAPPFGEDDPDRVETWTAYPAPPAPCDACGFFGGMCPECDEVES